MNITQLSTNQLVRLYLYSLEIYDPFQNLFSMKWKMNFVIIVNLILPMKHLYELVDLNGHVVRRRN